MSSDHPDVLFVPYEQTLALLSVEDAMRICENVYLMHARGSVTWSTPQRMRLDTEGPLHNHWHIKAVLLRDVPSRACVSTTTTTMAGAIPSAISIAPATRPVEPEERPCLGDR